MQKERKVLLTGASGFVGRHVLNALQEKQCAVRCVARPGAAARLEARPAAGEVVTTADLFAERPDWWARACEGVDAVIHAAWYVEPGEYLQSPQNLHCLSGTLDLARGAAAAGVRRFVGIGTCFEYDLTRGMLYTDTPLAPTTVYAGAKAATWHALSQYLPPQGVSFAWARLFYLYGEGEDPRRLVPVLHARLAAGEPVDLTSGDQVRDYLDAAEAGRMLVDCALGDAGGAVNICSGRPVTLRQLAESVADRYGRRDLLRFGARPDNLVDPPCVLGVRGPAPRQ